ncbi:MAG TPA: transposase [Candidatus Paceibacterota bacterium]
MRKLPQFENGEYYHIYNRGVDKCDLFKGPKESARFLESMAAFNTVRPVGSLYELSFRDRKLIKADKKLVDIIAYCLNPNHFHLILKQLRKGGVSEFMKRLGAGYTCHINEKNKRVGALFAGSYKVKHITSNDHLLHLSAYVSLNYEVHGIKSPVIRSSWQEYISIENIDQLCNSRVILNQFKSKQEYKKFAEEAIAHTAKQRKEDKEFNAMFIEHLGVKPPSALPPMSIQGHITWGY